MENLKINYSCTEEKEKCYHSINFKKNYYIERLRTMLEMNYSWNEKRKEKKKENENENKSHLLVKTKINRNISLEVNQLNNIILICSFRIFIVLEINV